MALSVEKSLALDHRLMLEHDYAVINVMQVEPKARADLVGSPIVPARFDEQSHLFPLLVNLRELPEHKRLELIDRTTAWYRIRGTSYLNALLSCPDDEKTVLRHLVGVSDVRLPNGARDILRLHDARVFRHLPRILRHEQMNVLLGNIRQWTWCEPDGTWCRLENSHSAPTHRLKSLRLETDQWPLLMRLPDIHAILASLQQVEPALCYDDTLVLRVDAALLDAEQKLPHPRAMDRRLFAEHVIRFGERLQRHALFQTHMAPVQASQQSYFSAFAGLSDETLQAWAASSEFAKECS